MYDDSLAQALSVFQYLEVALELYIRDCDRLIQKAVKDSFHYSVRARLCRAPWRWRWSSAAAHVAGRDDSVVQVAPLLERAPDWKGFLTEGLHDEAAETLRRHERTGRPLGGATFLDRIERRLRRSVRPAKAGRKPKGTKK